MIEIVFVLLQVSSELSSVETADDAITYTTDDPQAFEVEKRALFSKARNRIISNSPDEIPVYWDSDRPAGLYKEAIEAGIRYDIGSALSVPVDIVTQRSWESGDWHCGASKLGTGWRIACNFARPRGVYVDYRAYDYDPSRGITGFTMQCGKPIGAVGGKMGVPAICWYSLRSQAGILK